MTPCDSCHAGCCRSFAVPVTGADIISIERHTGLTFWDFICRWADPTGRIARNSVPHFFFDDAPNTPFVMCLLQTDSIFIPETSKCRFLMEGAPDEEHPLGQARCGIYGNRPSACRVFPTKFNETGDLVVLHDVPELGRSEGHPAYELCPRQWQASDVDPVRSLQDLVIARYEMAFFSELARIWNQVPRAWKVFPDFLRLVYSNRARRADVNDLKIANEEAEPDVVPFPTNRGQDARRRAA